jgi:hypothetical protein
VLFSTIKKIYILLAILLSITACSTKKHDKDDVLTEVSKAKLTPEESEEVLSELGESWIYGDGVGKATLNIGTSLAFPPYALYLLANAVASYSGYEPMYVSEALPTDEKEHFDVFYSSITAAPGALVASLAGEEYRSEELVRQKIRNILEKKKSEATHLQPEE